MDREHARAGGWFEHAIVRAERGGDCGDIGKAGRRGELLERLARLRSTRVAGQQSGDPLDQRERTGRRAGKDRAAIFAQKQDRRRLTGVIAGLPIPGAFGIAGVEGLRHGGAQFGGVDLSAGFERGQEPGGGKKDRRGGGGEGGRGGGWRDVGRRVGQGAGHGKSPGGWVGQPADLSLWSCRARPFPASPLPLTRVRYPDPARRREPSAAHGRGS